MNYLGLIHLQSGVLSIVTSKCFRSDSSAKFVGKDKICKNNDHACLFRCINN